ncbi:MAG: glycosyltransferase [Alphaproteobacteria bacterium]|nr:glycosyltransferase [Alphaproteobacteria bacterium]
MGAATATQPATRALGEDVLVAIPVLNEAAHIETCIRSLMKADSRISRALFVVSDGGSTDDTRGIVSRLMAEYGNLKLINNPGRLQSIAVNLAAREFGGDRRVLVRCDAHAIYPENYVLAVADSLLSRGVASVTTPMDAVGDSCFQRANAFIVDTPLGSGGSAHRGGKVSKFVDHGHHAGFDLKSFLRIGGYDESFSHNEDAEFDRRLAKAGGRIFLDADIRIAYRPRASVGSLARQYFNYGKGRARNLMKHGDRPKPRQMIPQAVLLACLLGFLVAPFSPWGLVLPGGYIALLALASVAVAVKMKSPCGLLAGLASGVMHMSWAAGYMRQMLSPPRLPPEAAARPAS